MRDLISTFGGHFMSPVADPYPVYARLRQEEPVKPLDLPQGPGYLVTRYDDAMAVLKKAELFSARANAKGIGLVMGRTILEMDGREHTRHRNIISPAFLPKALLGELPGVITAIAHRLIDAFVSDRGADLVSQFTKTFPLRVIAHIMGVPIEDYATFQTWSLDLIGFASDPAKGFAAATALVDFLRPLVESRKNASQPDLLSRLVHAEVDGQRLEDDEIYSFLRLLLPAGAETTYRLIGSTLFALLAHPDQLEEARADRTQIEWAIEEALRWEAPVQFAAREAVEDTAIGCTPVQSGTQVLVAIGSANRDERHYDEPGSYAMHRRADDHLAFGFGQHFCVGSHLARLEAQIALNAVFDRLPNLRLDPSHAAAVVGLAFRSPDRLPVLFDAGQ